MGSAKNILQLSKLFDKVYYLHVDEQVILERLKRRAESGESYHDNGKTSEQQTEIIRKAKSRMKIAKERGFEFINGTLTPEEIYKLITKTQQYPKRELSDP